MEDASELEVLERLRQASGVGTDNVLAQRLDLSRQSIAKAKATKSVPSAWVPKAALLFGVTTDWLFFGCGPMRPGDQPEQATRTPEAATQGGEACERCRTLEKRLEAVEDERRELSTENRQLLKDNGALKLENLTLTHQLDESRKMRHEAERKLQAAEEGTIPFNEAQIIPPSDVRPRR